jgi:hypothetical protein
MATAKSEPEKVVEKAEEADQSVQDKGYRGVQADETPNENYTVAGVLAGKPTPETEQK